MSCSLALVLHSHLPYVRHTEYEDALEENWLFECITETYMPLLLTFDRLIKEKIPFRLTLSLTPTLTAMLDDPLLQTRYISRLDSLIELSEKELLRTRSNRRLNSLALFYQKKLIEIKRAYIKKYQGDIVSAFARLQRRGHIEIMASAATHGYLPLLAADSSSVSAQVRVGIESYTSRFGARPRGFWLPECAYYAGLDKLLAAEGIAYTILETHGITRAVPTPKEAIYSAIKSPAGLVCFGRDPDSSKQVWSSAEGYPGDSDYREFYRDIAYDLDSAYMGPHIHPLGIRIDSGFKYYRVTGKGNDKEFYSPAAAQKKACMHAADFISKRIAKSRELEDLLDNEPVFVAPFDAELFGHWWYEGPLWIEQLIRQAAKKEGAISLIKLSDYIKKHKNIETAEPSMSSWGDKGYSSRWLNPKNDWIYKPLHNAAATLKRLAAKHPDARGLTRRALNQACRELLLAQASDWPFMLDGEETAEYAEARLMKHLEAVDLLAWQISQKAIDKKYVARLEAEDLIFEDIDYRAWA